MATISTVLETRPRISSGVRRSITANRAAFTAGASSRSRPTGTATSGDGISRAAQANSSAPVRVITVASVPRRRRPCNWGAIKAPSSPPTAMAACTNPITVVEVPCWRSESVIVNSTPLKAKFTSGAVINTARRMGTRQTNWSPSTTSRHNTLRSTVRFGRNRPWILLTVPNEIA